MFWVYKKYKKMTFISTKHKITYLYNIIILVFFQAVSDIVASTLGPRSMLKMLIDPMGGIVMTNDGNAILREIDANHPAAKSMIELARA